MDIKELQPLLKQSASVVLVEDGQPTAVVLPYGAYRALTGQETAEQVPVSVRQEEDRTRTVTDTREQEILERLNREIASLKEQLSVDQALLDGE